MTYDFLSEILWPWSKRQCLVIDHLRIKIENIIRQLKKTYILFKISAPMTSVPSDRFEFR